MLDHRFIRPGGLRERFFRRLEHWIDGLPDLIVPSGAAAEEYLRGRGVPAKRISLVPDGVDTDWLDPQCAAGKRVAMRERLGIPPEAPVIVYLGLLAEYQGADLLLRAARRVLERRPDAYLLVAGYPGADRYAQLARELALDGHVLFPGRVPYEEAPALLAAGDVAVAPKMSLTESNGKLLNYMAMRLPVVAFNSAANRAILGGLGHLVPLGDADALADALLCALNDPPVVRDALRARVVDEFAWSARVHDLEAVYARVLGCFAEKSSDGAIAATGAAQLLTPSSQVRPTSGPDARDGT